VCSRDWRKISEMVLEEGAPIASPSLCRIMSLLFEK